MLGGIYCGDCGGRVTVEQCKCPKHPEAGFRVKFPGMKPQRKKTWEEAEDLWVTVNYLHRNDRLKPDEFGPNNPLLIGRLGKEWLKVKKEEVINHTYLTYDRWISGAIKAWGRNSSIRDIGFREIQKYVLAYPAADATRNKVAAGLHVFFAWVWDAYPDRLEGVPMPKFPKIECEETYQDTLTKYQQQKVLDALYAISWDKNPRIWLMAFLLATYPKMRPGEARTVDEGDMLLDQGLLRIRKGKGRKPKAKMIPILEEDAELIRKIRDMEPRAIPTLPFFRELHGRMGVPAGQRFSKGFLYRWWKKACEAAEVKYIPLYPSTKHSTVQALDEFFGEKEIQNSTGVSSNSSFTKYFGHDADRLRKVYRKARPETPFDRPGPKVDQIFGHSKTAKLPKIKE